MDSNMRFCMCVLVWALGLSSILPSYATNEVEITSAQWTEFTTAFANIAATKGWTQEIRNWVYHDLRAKYGTHTPAVGQGQLIDLVQHASMTNLLFDTYEELLVHHSNWEVWAGDMFDETYAIRQMLSTNLPGILESMKVIEQEVEDNLPRITQATEGIEDDTGHLVMRETGEGIRVKVLNPFDGQVSGTVNVTVDEVLVGTDDTQYHTNANWQAGPGFQQGEADRDQFITDFEDHDPGDPAPDRNIADEMNKESDWTFNFALAASDWWTEKEFALGLDWADYPAMAALIEVIRTFFIAIFWALFIVLGIKSFVGAI